MHWDTLKVQPNYRNFQDIIRTLDLRRLISMHARSEEKSGQRNRTYLLETSSKFYDICEHEFKFICLQMQAKLITNFRQWTIQNVYKIPVPFLKISYVIKLRWMCSVLKTFS